MSSKTSFTGHSRRRKTRAGVRLGEVVSRLVITVGGIGTIAAVITVGVFLVYVAAPLFRSASVSAPTHLALPAKDQRLLRAGVDDYQLLGWTLYADGTLTLVRLDTGKVLQQRQLFPGQTLTACSAPSREEEIAFGFADGTVRIGRVGFVRQFLPLTEVPEKLRELPPGEIAELELGTLTRLPEKRRGESPKFRSQTFVAEIDKPLKSDNTSPVVLLDHSVRTTGFVVSALTADGALRTSAVTKKKNLALDTVILEVDEGQMPLPARAGGKPPSYLLVSGVGDNVFAVWDDGHAVRVSTQRIDKPRVVEEFDLVGPEATLTALQFMIGKTTLLAGDSTGRVRAWFRVHRPAVGTGDGGVMVAAHEFAATGSPVTCLAVSSRTRMAAAGDEAGRVRLFYVTNERPLAEVRTEHGAPVRDLVLAPRDDGLIARTAEGVLLCRIDPAHPEITLAALIRPVWYEGYEAPAHVWQSSSGSDEFEPKLGMWPLIFGTLKGTFYALLMGVPVALLAAIYTSQFLLPAGRNVVKPTIESMASLPSVVLGFVAALVLAPFVDSWLAAVLAALLTVPAAFVVGAYLWQLLPEKLALRLARFRFAFLLAVLPAGLGAAALVGPLLEKVLFGGDIKVWLNDRAANPTPGWMVLFLPLALLVTVAVLGQVVNPWLRRTTRGCTHGQHALIDLGKFLAAAVCTVGLALALGAALTVLGLDPRGTFFGTYVQRNALVVGFMMGFAIIPIIFTIADDALSAVPEHLRSASLGCGATPWQTATRVIIPTAMSGLFSAVMIGLGRAVGETMIVLMAAGNSPVMEMNVFNGFRTLSANIAVELPEAVRDSTHFRTLFLSAVVLFAMTFVLNSIAEAIRLRFRRRAFQL
jgi:phosphate transport system permease protein